jgi:hypothetical protein
MVALGLSVGGACPPVNFGSCCGPNAWGGRVGRQYFRGHHLSLALNVIFFSNRTSSLTHCFWSPTPPPGHFPGRWLRWSLPPSVGETCGCLQGLSQGLPQGRTQSPPLTPQLFESGLHCFFCLCILQCYLKYLLPCPRDARGVYRRASSKGRVTFNFCFALYRR